MNYKIGVYKIYFKNKPNVFYVGSTIGKKGFSERFYRHRSRLRKNIHENSMLQNAYNKYGEGKLVIEIIEECSKEICLDREQYWINELNSYTNGYNLTKSVNSGPCLTFEQLRNNTKKQQKIVYQIDKNSEVINIFEGISEASRKTNISRQSISKCCNNKIKHSGGYKWCFKNNYTEDIKYDSNRHFGGILQYDLNGKFIRRWNSIAEASKRYYKGSNDSNLYGCCRGSCKSAKGFIWKYE